jgi:hypothetical protein
MEEMPWVEHKECKLSPNWAEAVEQEEERVERTRKELERLIYTILNTINWSKTAICCVCKCMNSWHVLVVTVYMFVSRLNTNYLQSCIYCMHV